MRHWLALTMLLIGAASVAAAFSASSGGRDLALYNHSRSLPVGIYVRVAKADSAAERLAARGAIVTVRARDVAPELAASRGFTGSRDRFLKRVAAIEGDEVCSDEAGLRINDVAVFPQQREARTGAQLATWTGCRRLIAGEALLLGDTPDSFDGRYWGPIDARLIEGAWRRL